MKTFTIFHLFLVLIAILLILPGLANADSHIWFNDPHPNQTIYIPPGSSSIQVYWDITAVPIGPPLYYFSKTKVKIDGGGWMENVQQGWPVLGPGMHTFAAELWEANIDGIWNPSPTGTDNITITIIQQYNVTVKNNFDGGSLYIDGVRYDNVPLAGITNAWAQNTSHNATALDNQNVGGYVRSFNNWTWLPSGSTPNTNVTFQVTQTNTYSANFARIFDISITAPNYVEPGSGAAYKVNGTNVGATWQGTFREGTLTPITLEGVPQGSGWNFAYWSDGNTQNPRQFTPTDHTTLSATFKEHLYSTSSSMTAPTAQRKIIRDANGNYHMAFESGSQIWYTRSTNGGTSWVAEQRITSGLGFGVEQRPSITVQKNGTTHLIRVVWEVYDDAPYAAYSCTIDPSTGTIGTAQWLSYVGGSSGASAMPCVAVGKDANHNSYVLAAWYDGSTSSIMACVDQGVNSWTSPSTLYTGAASDLALAPISRDRYDNPPPAMPWNLVWTNGAVYYSSISVSTTPTMGTIETVAPSPEVQVPHSPSVVNVAGAPGVAWVEMVDGTSLSSIKYRLRYGTNNWSTTMVWTPYYKTNKNYKTPSMSADDSSGNVQIAWNFEASGIYYTTQNSGTWSSPASLVGGYDPMVSVGYKRSSTELVLSRSTSSPYPIQQSSISTGHPGQGPLSAPAAEGRGGRVFFSDGLMHLAVMRAALNGSALSFVPLVDSISISTLSHFASSLVSSPFSGSGTMDLDVLYSHTQNIPDGAAFNLEIHDAKTGRKLTTVRQFSTDRDTTLSMSVEYNYGARSVVLALAPVLAGQAASYEVERWIVTDTNQTGGLAKAPAVVEATVRVRLLPNEFGLHQNYPNPFNPSTQIDFELPSGGLVMLAVYDVLGREVAELARGYREAGSYTVTWNAATNMGEPAASGVYLARLNVTDSDGKSQFTAVTKMLLMK